MGFRTILGEDMELSRAYQAAVTEKRFYKSGSSFIFKFSPGGQLADSWLVPGKTEEKGNHEIIGGLIFGMINNVPYVFTNSNQKNLTTTNTSQKSAKKVTSNSKAYAIALKDNGKLDAKEIEVTKNFYLTPCFESQRDGKITTMIANRNQIKPLVIEF